MCPGVFVRLYLCVAVLRACPCQVIAAGPWPYPVSHQVYCCLEKLVSELEGVSIDNVSVVCPHGTCSWELPLEVAKVGASRLRPGVHWLCHKCGKNFPLAGFSSSWGVADSSVAPDALAACVDATVEHTARLPQGAHRDESRIHTARALSKYVCGRKSCGLVGVRACLRACLRAATKNSMHGAAWCWLRQGGGDNRYPAFPPTSWFGPTGGAVERLGPGFALHPLRGLPSEPHEARVVTTCYGRCASTLTAYTSWMLCRGPTYWQLVAATTSAASPGC